MTTKKMRIVCGTDFSVQAAEAATVATMLAARLNESLILIHVLANSRLVSTSSDLPAALRAVAQKRLHVEAERLRKLGPPAVKEELLTGSPYEELVEAGGRSSTRLVVVSSLGRIAVNRFLVGSVAERTAEHSRTPTLVIRGSAPFEAWLRGERALKVVAGYDFSASSDAALRWISDLQRLSPCEVTVTHVNWPPQDSAGLGVPIEGSLAENPPELQARLEHDLEQQVTPILGLENVRVRVVSAWGRPDVPLLEVAQESGADLIVVGTHQRHGVSRFWLGSVSRAVLRYSPTSVAVVPPPFGMETQPGEEHASDAAL